MAALMTGLSEAPLGEVLAHLTAVDASNFAVLRSHVGALGGEDAAKTLRALITMMMGAMDVPVAMACVVEQADVAVDVVAAEQEPAERRSLPRAGSRWLPRPPARSVSSPRPRSV